MVPVQDCSSFLANAVGRALIGPRYLIWSKDAMVSGTVAWGAIDAADARIITRAWDYERQLAVGYRSVVDLGDLTFIDPRAFFSVERDMSRRLPDLGPRLGGQALVRPGGMAGVLVAGFYAVLPPRFSWAVFAERRAAYSWAFGDAGPGVLAEVEELAAQARSGARSLSLLRTMLHERLADDIRIEDLARAVGQSVRSVQRTLAAGGTTFRDELRRLRLERAATLLQSSDLKLDAVARAVGLRSTSAFVAMFREATGLTPGEHRARYRSGANPSDEGG